MTENRLLLEVRDHLEPLTDEWEELAERTHAPPFVRPGWIGAWRGAFGRGRLRLFVLRRGDRLAALIPLEQRRGALRSPTNEHTPEFGLLAVDEDAAGALARAVFAHGARAVVVAWLDADGTALAVLRSAARDAGYRDLISPMARSPYIIGRRDLREHERRLSRNLRHDVQRRLRRLCEAGAVSVQVCDGTDRLEELLEEGFRVERHSWKGDGGTAIGSRAETLRFYTEVARWAASEGWLRLAFLRLDERPIAFQLDLEAGGTYRSLKIGYDATYERFSPGKLLAYTMVSRAMSKGLATYELLGTDEPWKERWTNTFHERVALHAFAGSPSGRLTRWAFAYGRPLARRVPLAARVGMALRR